MGGGKEGRNGELLSSEYRVSDLQDEQVLEIDSTVA